MPALDNPKYEKFAQGVAKGMAIVKAFKAAGYSAKDLKVADSNAFKLMRNPKIKARIIELQTQNAARLGVTVEKLVDMLTKMYNLSTKVNHPAAGVGAVMAMARLLGFDTKPDDSKNAPVRKPMREPSSTTSMSMEEWHAKFAPPAAKSPPKIKASTKPEGNA